MSETNTDRAYRAALAYTDGMVTVEEAAVNLVGDLLDMLAQDYNMTVDEVLPLLLVEAENAA